ncbi:MAG: hypothetical protein SPF23_00785 [Paludibacteraceae bacterium]|nr:hypothetical protein [Paludibacteraceae bacterium]
MRTNSLNNSFSLLNYKNLNNIGRYIATIAVVLFLAMGNVQAGNRYYSRVTGASNPTSGGGVIVNTSNTASGEVNTQVSGTVNTSAYQEQIFYAWAKPNPGYYWTSWEGTKNKTNASISITNPQTATAQELKVITAKSTSDYDYRSGNNGTGFIMTYRDYAYDYTITANFAAIKVNSYVRHDNLEPKSYTAPCSGSATFTLDHTADTSDLNIKLTPAAGNHGTFTLGLITIDDTKVTVNYTFKGNGTNYGGDDDNRKNSATLLVESKGDEGNGKSCTITANFPNARITGGSADTLFTTFKAADATQAGVQKKAVFDVEYVDGKNNFDTPPSIKGTDASKFVYDSMSYADGKLTVYYTYNGNKTAGDHTATLTLKVNEAIGGTDATYGSKSVTLTAHNAQEATYDVEVYNASGVKISEDSKATWAYGLDLANQNAGSTLKLMRDIDLGELSASQEIKDNITLDLNGKTLSASLKANNAATYQRMFWLNTAAKTFTIMDSKTGGTIDVSANYANAKYAIYVAKGNVVLNSGKVQIKNTTTGNSNVTYATGVYVAAGTTFTMNGGEIFASHPAYRRADGVLGAGSPTVPSTITINGGKIIVESGTHAYGVSSTGIVNVHNVAEINANTLTGAYAYGLYMGAYSNATEASCYSSTLTMTGGTINATTKTSNAYGIYTEASQTASASATDGTLTNKSAAVLNITGGTINSTTTTTTAYGIYVMGRYNSLTKTYSISQIKNATVNAIGKRGTAYGVYSAASTAAANGGLLLGDVELTDVTVNAITESVTADGKTTNYNTAYCLYVQATQTTGTGANNTGVEYAAGAKMTVNSGTYTATTTGTDAYSAVTGQRSITFNEGAEGLPELIIHGGKFVANAGTSRARAVSTGGYTTIDGGEFHSTAGTSTAYGLYAITGKLTANGVKVTATAQNSTAYGAYLEASVTNYDGIKAGVLNHGEMVLNNLDVTATTVTGNDARGVSVYTASRTLTQAQFDALSDANKTKYDKTFVMQDGVTRGGQWACAGKLTVNGGTYNVTSAGITAYGACLNTTTVTANMTNASGEMTLKNATFNVQTNNANAVSNNRTNTYGVNAGGKTTIDGCTFNITGAHTNTYGVWATNKKTTIGNSKITTSGKVSVYGIYGTVDINSTNGYTTYADIELNEGNNITTTATAGNSAYALYLSATKKAIVSGDFAGDYAIAATAIVNGGKYTATASGTTAYAACVADPVLQGEATATPTLIINGGKFKGTAGAAPFADVSVNGEPGYFVLNGGYYVKDENLDKKLGEGMNKVAVNSGTPEYTEGYRWRITDNMTGEIVCKVYEGTTLKQSYQSLEEALAYVNLPDNSSKTQVIVMCGNYTLSSGDYELPANKTLLVPYRSSGTGKGATEAVGTSPAWVDFDTKYEAPTPLYKLTMASGVNITVKGSATIEASCVVYVTNGSNGASLLTQGTGIPHGKYGWIYMEEGSHIDLESGATLISWGFITGKGEINAKNGSKVYEDFQMGDWRGGTYESAVNGNKNGLNNKGVFPITHYYYQNIECPITYRAGSTAYALGGTAVNAPIFGTQQAITEPAVQFIGTSGSMFLLDPATAGADTWVRKEYDPETDYVNWTLNSGARIGSITLKMSAMGININLESSNYVLPITTNFNIIANYGDVEISNDVAFLPGSKLTIKKEANVVIPSGKNVFFYDQDDWKSYSGYWFCPGYSPSWKKNPRSVLGANTSIKMPDAEVLIEGILTINGKVYTTAGGSNVYSTRANSGKVVFNASAADSTAAVANFTEDASCNTTLCQWVASNVNSDGKVHYEGKALKSVWLKNEDGEFSKTGSDGANTQSGKTWIYMEDDDHVYRWILSYDDGCFTYKNNGGGDKQLIHPSDWVAVQANANGDHAYHSEVGTRMFVNTEAPDTLASCVWWEVDPTPDTIGDTKYYIANNENFDNFGTYYYWDSITSYWKPKKITVTWKNYDGSKLENGTYGDEYNFNTSPQFYGTNPTKTNTTVEKHDWIGWRDEEGNIYDKNATLPRAKSNVTYTAYFNTTKYQYTITFKNKALPDGDGKVIWSGLMDATTTEPAVCPVEPTQEPTISTVYEFDYWEGYQGSNLPAVTAAATYTAVYKSSTRQYHVTFYNYDAVSVLYEADVDYNANPVYGGVTPFRANTSAFSYDWTGWKQGATTYGTSDKLPKVMGDISYIATFDTTALKYQVLFKRQDGSIIDAPFFTYGEIPSAFPANPKMASTVSTDYTFREWSPATLEPVTEDGKVYTALFDESPRQYTAHFVNYNGVSLNKDQTIDYNKVPEYTGATPFKPNDARNSYVFSGWAWAAGDGWEAGSIAAGEAFPAIKGNITFTAQFTPTLLQLDAGFYVDIVDVDNSEKTLKLNVSGTEWVTAGWPYEVNDTVYYRDQAKATAAGSDKYRATDRTLTIPYTGEPGENFTVTIRNASSTLVSKHTYIIPQEIKSATTLTTDQTAPIFVKGATLTVNADIEATNIYVGHDAKLVINSGVTLTADSLFLRTKPESAAELVINESGAVAGTTKVVYTRIILSKSGYFQFGLPLSCPISAVRLSNGKTVGYKSGTGWILRYYDEDKRATTGPGDNWATLDAAASIAAGRGYEMYSGVDYYREFYFPVDLSQMTNTVHVDYTAGEQPTNNGWNVLVSPLTHTFTNTPQPEGMKISWMQLDGSFLQEPLTTVAPAMTFAYQAVKEGSLVFDGSNVTVPTLAPRRVAAVEEATRIQWMHLDIKDANGLGDQTSIYSHPTRYDQTFKMGVDEEKQSLTASRALLYSSHAYGEMAFAGVADELLEQGVALTVYSPKTQELTISMRENEWLNRMVSVWLIDKATGAQIDLLESDYSFSAEAGTTAGRFILMGAFFAPQITTDNGTVQGDEDIKAKKFIYKDKMYIQINGVIYDATGKLVK